MAISGAGKIEGMDTRRNMLFPVILTVLVLLGSTSAIALGQTKLMIPALSLIAPALAGSLWLFTHTRRSHGEPLLRRAVGSPVFLLLYLSSIIALLVSGSRNYVYVTIVSLSYAVILIQILQIGKNSPRAKTVIAELALNVVGVAWGIVNSHPAYFGGGDIFNHMRYTEVINSTGHTIPVDLDAAYAPFPLFHVLASALSETSGIGVSVSLFLIGALISVLIMSMAFVLVRRITADLRLALISALVLSVAPVFVYYSYYPVPRSEGFVLCLFILYVISRFHGKSSRGPNAMVLVVFSGSLILVHSATVVQMLLPMMGIVLVERYIRKSRMFRVRPFLTLSTMVIGYWMLVATTFSTAMLNHFAKPVDLFESSIEGTELNLSVFFKDHIPMALFLFFFVVGLEYSLQRRKKLFSVALVSLPLLVFYFPNPIKESEAVLSYYGFYRFELFAELFIVVIAAAGITIFLSDAVRNMSKTARVAGFAVLTVAIFLTAFASLTTSANATDMTTQTNARYFTSEESNAIQFTVDSTDHGSTIVSDYFVSRYFESYRYFSLSNNTGIPYFVSEIMDLDGIENGTGTYILRMTELESRGTMVLASGLEILSVTITVKIETKLTYIIEISNLVCDLGGTKVLNR